MDVRSGAVTLPGDFALHPALRMKESRGSDLFDSQKVCNPGTPWYYHRFVDGSFEEMPLSFVVCFYENAVTHEAVLTDFSFGVVEQARAVENAKIEICDAEKDAKQLILNRRLLEQLAGKPHFYQKNMSSSRSCAVYDYLWGRIWCGSEDIKTNMMDVDISLRYFDNTKWAHDDYNQHLKKIENPFWKSWKR